MMDMIYFEAFIIFNFLKNQERSAIKIYYKYVVWVRY